MNILIAGCGYIGLPLGLSLKDCGHEVTGWVFSKASGNKVSTAGLREVVGDLAKRQDWDAYKQQFDAIIYCPSTRGGTPEDYQRIYMEGMQNALTALKSGGRFLYTASTSVYGQNDGSLVDEESPTEPQSGGGKILLGAEQVALSVRGTVLRLSAIYGPGRGMLLKRFLESSGSIPGNPDRYLNQINRNDVISATMFLLDQEESRGEIFNVTDNQPATHRAIYQWLAEVTKRPLPEFTGEPAMHKRGDTHRRISNRKLLRTGWLPDYPSYKEGYKPLLFNADSNRH
jgi:nucleoside-diphosphate-sugar epimerase